jgi:Domain of unknown function (DUF5658)
MLLEVFLYLQILDVISTLIGFSIGNAEASPFIRLLIRWGPVTGLIWSKLVAAGCLLLCILLNRWRLIRYINYWYAALVTWNLYSILRVAALRNYNSPIPNAGVFTAYRFASPANPAVTGPYGHFLRLVRVHSDPGRDAVFKFILSRQREGPYRSCWMVDGVEGLLPVP